MSSQEYEVVLCTRILLLRGEVRSTQWQLSVQQNPAAGVVYSYRSLVHAESKVYRKVCLVYGVRRRSTVWDCIICLNCMDEKERQGRKSRKRRSGGGKAGKRPRRLDERGGLNYAG